LHKNEKCGPTVGTYCWATVGIEVIFGTHYCATIDHIGATMT
jgi:hypothetical protein